MKKRADFNRPVIKATKSGRLFQGNQFSVEFVIHINEVDSARYLAFMDVLFYLKHLYELGASAGALERLGERLTNSGILQKETEICELRGILNGEHHHLLLEEEVRRRLERIEQLKKELSVPI